MIKYLYVIHDKSLDSFAFFGAVDGVRAAFRSLVAFLDLEDVNRQYFNFPQDYVLLPKGTIDTDTGTITPLDKENPNHDPIFGYRIQFSEAVEFIRNRNRQLYLDDQEAKKSLEVSNENQAS